MKKILFGIMLLALANIFIVPGMARADVSISVSLPPLVVFDSPPEMVVLPDTYVYVVTDSDADIFFYDGWWWRLWEGRWYRSHYYNSGWGYYQNVPVFYSDIPSGWRSDYREHRWYGHPWNYQRIPHQQVQANWSGWQKNKHWEKHNSWGVQGLHSKPVSRAVQPAREAQSVRKAQPARKARQVQAVQPQVHVERTQGHESQAGRGRPQGHEGQSHTGPKPSGEGRSEREHK